MTAPDERRASRRLRRIAGVIAIGIFAGSVSTLAQIVLWLLFTDAWPGILYRDARLAAAIVRGPAALGASAGFDLSVMTLASAVHAVLSVLYAALFCRIACAVSRPVLGGTLLGAALYVINMYGFTAVFPWFAAARDWITLSAHVVFGVACTFGCAWLRRRSPPLRG